MTDFNYKVIGKQAELSERVQFLETQDRTLKYVRRTMLPRSTIGADSYTVSPYDTYIGWCGGTVSKGGTIQFEAPGTVGGNAGRLVIIKDEVGSAASFPILIEGTSAQTFDGIGSVALKVNYGAIGVVSNGTTWQVAFRDPPESFGSARFNDGVRMGGTSGLVVGGTTTSVAGSTGYFMGSVGIGVNPPTAPLDVVGNVIVSGHVSADHLHMTTPASGNVIGSGATAGAVLRCMYVVIENGTDAAHIKCTTGNRWNGDVNAAQDNIGKDGVDTGVWNLDATGGKLKLLDAGITGTIASVLMASTTRNLGGTSLTVDPFVSGTAIELDFYNATTGAAVDLSTLVDTGAIYAQVEYLTTA